MRWKSPWHYARLRFHLNIIHDAVKMARIPDTELFVGVRDGPKAADDTSAPINGLPIFSYVTSEAHIDILIPDPFEMGAFKFRYNFKNPPPDIAWENKTSELYFRGGLTNFPLRGFNWNLSPRVRAAMWSWKRNDSVYNMHLTGSGNGQIAEFKADTNISIARKMSLEEQCGYKWILNLDGAWGSCRTASILRCGSLLVKPRSAWFSFSSRMLEEHTHYISVDRPMRNLRRVIDWLRQNDAEARNMAERAKHVGDTVLTREAALHYWSLLLPRWAGLFRKGLDFSPRDSDWDHCAPGESQELLRTGPNNCSRGWLEFTSLAAFDSLYSGFPLEA